MEADIVSRNAEMSYAEAQAQIKKLEAKLADEDKLRTQLSMAEIALEEQTATLTQRNADYRASLQRAVFQEEALIQQSTETAQLVSKVEYLQAENAQMEARSQDLRPVSTWSNALQMLPSQREVYGVRFSDGGEDLGREETLSPARREEILSPSRMEDLGRKQILSPARMEDLNKPARIDYLPREHMSGAARMEDLGRETISRPTSNSGSAQQARRSIQTLNIPSLAQPSQAETKFNTLNISQPRFSRHTK